MSNLGKVFYRAVINSANLAQGHELSKDDLDQFCYEVQAYCNQHGPEKTLERVKEAGTRKGDSDKTFAVETTLYKECTELGLKKGAKVTIDMTNMVAKTQDGVQTLRSGDDFLARMRVNGGGTYKRTQKRAEQKEDVSQVVKERTKVWSVEANRNGGMFLAGLWLKEEAQMKAAEDPTDEKSIAVLNQHTTSHATHEGTGVAGGLNARTNLVARDENAHFVNEGNGRLFKENIKESAAEDMKPALWCMLRDRKQLTADLVKKAFKGHRRINVVDDESLQTAYDELEKEGALEYKQQSSNNAVNKSAMKKNAMKVKKTTNKAKPKAKAKGSKGKGKGKGGKGCMPCGP